MLINMVLPGAVETARLPAEYQEVEYIRSSGTQYINSNYKPTSEKLRIVCAFEYTAAHDSASVFGSQSGQHWSIVAYGSPAFYVGNGGNGNLLPQTTSLNTKYVLDVTADNGKLTVNLNGAVQTATYNNGLLTTQNIGIFCNIINGVAQQLCSMKLYRMLIYDNDVLVREFYPCYRKSGSAIGLFDLVNDAFYTNSGTGTFTKGTDVSGNGSSGELFTFTYSGNFTDNRVDGVGTVRLNTSGTLTVTGSPITVTATIVGAGGGGVYHTNMSARRAGGGGGGIQTVEVTLEPGTYDIVIGTGGAGYSGISAATAGTGGNTTAFGKTSTGGKGASLTSSSTSAAVGTGGSPNGNNGSGTTGGAPNGGNAGSNGGDGYVALIFI